MAVLAPRSCNSPEINIFPDGTPYACNILGDGACPPVIRRRAMMETYGRPAFRKADSTRPARRGVPRPPGPQRKDGRAGPACGRHGPRGEYPFVGHRLGGPDDTSGERGPRLRP